MNDTTMTIEKPVRVTKKSLRDQEQREAVEALRKYLNPGDTVYAVLRHVSASGMQRRIDLFTITKDSDGVSRLQYLSGWAATAMGDKRSDKGGIVVNGCGMDMGFHLVYNLTLTLGFKAYELRHEWI